MSSALGSSSTTSTRGAGLSMGFSGGQHVALTRRLRERNAGLAPAELGDQGRPFQAEQARAFLAAENPGGRLVTPLEVAVAVRELLAGEETGREVELDGRGVEAARA